MREGLKWRKWQVRNKHSTHQLSILTWLDWCIWCYFSCVVYFVGGVFCSFLDIDEKYINKRSILCQTSQKSKYKHAIIYTCDFMCLTDVWVSIQRDMFLSLYTYVCICVHIYILVFRETTQFIIILIRYKNAYCILKQWEDKLNTYFFLLLWYKNKTHQARKELELKLIVLRLLFGHEKSHILSWIFFLWIFFAYWSWNKYLTPKLH